MRKIRILVLAFIMLFNVIPFQGVSMVLKAQTTNLIVNGDFESGNQVPWIGRGMGVSIYAKYNGRYGHLLDQGSFEQSIALEKGKYQIQAIIKPVYGNGEWAILDSSGQVLVREVLEATNVWETYTLEFTLQEDKVVTVKSMVNAASRIDFDDFNLIKVSGDIEASKDMLMRIQPTLYPYFVNPEEYPDFERRPYEAITWDKLDGEDKTLLTAGRSNAGADEVSNVGKVYRSDLTWLYKGVENNELSGKLSNMADRGEVLHNIGGYGTGSPFGLKYGNIAGFGEYYIPKEVLDDILASGVLFTGFDIGEQDGRYNFTFKNYHQPYKQDKVEQYIQTQPFFDRVAETQLEYGSLLSVLWYWHYPIKEGYTLLAGAETQNKVTNSQVHYSFLRGAGKQYGVLWYGDISVFDTWGYRGGWGDDLSEAGPSLGLLKREYFYNTFITQQS